MASGSRLNCSSSRTRTVYCSSPSLYFETSSPPISVRMLDDTDSSGTPMSAARWRSIVIRSSGCVDSNVVSASVMPGTARMRCSRSVEYACSCSMSGPCTIMLRRFVLPPPPRPPPPELAPEMSVPPDTLMRAFLYRDSIRRVRPISSCCDRSRSSSGASCIQ